MIDRVIDTVEKISIIGNSMSAAYSQPEVLKARKALFDRITLAEVADNAPGFVGQVDSPGDRSLRQHQRGLLGKAMVNRRRLRSNLTKERLQEPISVLASGGLASSEDFRDVLIA